MEGGSIHPVNEVDDNLDAVESALNECFHFDLSKLIEYGRLTGTLCHLPGNSLRIQSGQVLSCNVHAYKPAVCSGQAVSHWPWDAGVADGRAVEGRHRANAEAGGSHKRFIGGVGVEEVDIGFLYRYAQFLCQLDGDAPTDSRKDVLLLGRDYYAVSYDEEVGAGAFRRVPFRDDPRRFLSGL